MRAILEKQISIYDIYKLQIKSKVDYFIYYCNE